MIVLDSSAAVEWLLGLSLADQVGDRIMATDSLHAPALLDVEVAQVVRRYTASGEITAQTGERALSALADLDAVRYTHELLLPLIWRLRSNLTAYDAAFVALAAVLAAPLLTLDARMARAPLSELLGQIIVVDLITGP
ncbi:type II toxin-antitoxin system VapC family toxin [Candidatus Poriferisocius sp.]|uniref:type II toxin-antitoxin system VapC family toxin n=1 Tax=Candidatus Poriferisocius sp. TaxID=3101276 RepID=UPI003B01CA41